MRFHHRICDAQKHLLQGTDNLMKWSINEETLMKYLLDDVKNFELLKKINVSHMRLHLEVILKM